MSEPPYRLTRYRSRAQRLLEQPKQLATLADRAARKAAGSKTAERLQAAGGQLVTMLALLRAWIRGDYRQVSNSALLSIAAAVLYFVAPLDAVPDFLLGLGLVDDVAVIGFVVKQVQHELEKFRSWQQQQPPTGDEERGK